MDEHGYASWMNMDGPNGYEWINRADMESQNGSLAWILRDKNTLVWVYKMDIIMDYDKYGYGYILDRYPFISKHFFLV
jgi:hypothetical protein